jgi:hypothetical protein
MNDAQRRALKPGDVVAVRMDDGTYKQCTVKYAPWQLGHGEWVIGLQGIAGGYRLSRVVAVPGRIGLSKLDDLQATADAFVGASKALQAERATSKGGAS